MNTDTLQLIGQVILIGLGPVLAKHGITLGNDELDKILGGFSLLAGVIWKFWHWNATPTASTSPQMKLPLPLLLVLLVPFLHGCAPLAPGADPLVVRVEQTETVAKSTFDLVLSVDNSKRDFFQTNAPAFHNFCEWLRTPQTVEGTNTLPRSSALLVSLDDVKLSYKSARASSNDVFIAWQTVTSAMAQANAWLVTETNAATLNP